MPPTDLHRKASTRGEATVVVLIVVVLLGGVIGIFKPNWFSGASRRAATGTATTAQLVQAVDNQGAAAAASVVKIAEANTLAPESPSRDFIAKEVPVALARLPAPDPVKLLEAEKRMRAVLEGNLDESRRLYEIATKQSAKLQAERDSAIAAKHAADLAVEKAAAAEHAKTVQLFGAGLVIVLLGAAWVYLKVYSIGPNVLGTMAAEMRTGKNPVQIMTDNLAPRFYARVQKHAQLATPLKDSS
jgi:hypothetical protein